MVDRAKLWAGVEGDDEDASEAERHTGELGYAGGAAQLHHLHPATMELDLAIVASVCICVALLDSYLYDLSSSAKQKVTTGMELPAAAATVADVNLRLTLYRLKLSVLLEISEEYVQKKIVMHIWIPCC